MSSTTRSTCSNCGRDVAPHTLSRHQEGRACRHHDRILELYLAGDSYRDVASELGFDKMTVYKHLDALGLMRSREEACVTEIAIDDVDDNEIAWFVGVLLCDAYVNTDESSDNTVSLGSIDEVFTDRFTDVLETIGLEPYTYWSSSNPTNDMKYSTVRSKRFVEWWRSMDHDDVEALAREHPAAFVRGVYDSDGHIHQPERGTVVTGITNGDTWLIDLVCELTKRSIGINWNGPYNVNGSDAIRVRGREARALHRWLSPTIPRKDATAPGTL